MFTNQNGTNEEFEEVQIEVPWGHVAGKLWGPQDLRPILCLHGWQDNAGSFDLLIPLLPKNASYLAIDFPGHGLSSHYPDGMAYNLMDFVHLIGIIMEYYQWDKVSILAHSLGAIVSFVYNACFPERCDMAISIDVLKPLIRENKEIVAVMSIRMDKMLEDNQRRRIKSKPPTYTSTEILDKLQEGARGSLTREAAECLAKRGAKESDIELNRYYFARDNRLKYYHFNHFPDELILEMISNISAPYFFIKAKDGPYYEDKKYYDQALEAFQLQKNFESIIVDGPHHVHLTHPTNVSEPISKFINIHRLRN